MNTEDWRNAKPEQINLWRNTSNLIAWVTCAPLYYMGAVAGSEFLTYNAGKLYIALEMQFCSAGDAAAQYVVGFYNEANALKFQASNVVGYYTGAAVHFTANVLTIYNTYFGRVDPAPATYMIFNGYKLQT